MVHPQIMVNQQSIKYGWYVCCFNHLIVKSFIIKWYDVKVVCFINRNNGK